MQLYMLGTGIDCAFYISICKDSDEIYTEQIRFDKELAEKYLAREAHCAGRTDAGAIECRPVMVPMPVLSSALHVAAKEPTK